MLSRWCAGILVDNRFADMQLVWCEQDLSYCLYLQDAIDTNMEVAKGDPELQYWGFEDPYRSRYLIRAGIHRERALELKICHSTAVRYTIFVGRHHLEVSAVPSKDPHRHYVVVPTFSQNLEAHRTLCVPSPPMLPIILAPLVATLRGLAICYARLQ